jgi:hypothetical protein
MRTRSPHGNCIGASVRWCLGRARDESLRASQGRTGGASVSLATHLANQYT